VSRVYATLDPHRLGDGLELLQGNLVVTTNKVCDFHRMVMGSIAIGVGTVAFECYFYSTSNPSAGLVNLSSVGVAFQDAALDQYVGEEADSNGPVSWGFRPSDGAGNAGIYAGDTDLDPLDQRPERHCLGVLLYNDPVSPFVAWQIDGNAMGQEALPTGKFYVPAVSIGSSASPDDNAAYLNFGQHPLDFPVFTVDIGGVSTQVRSQGWYEVNSEGIGTVYVCIEDEGMVSSPSDTPANTQYAPRVKNPETFSIKRAPSVWMDGDNDSGAAAFGTLVLDNRDGAYNFLTDNDVRDFVVVIKSVPAAALLTGTTVLSAPTVCTGIIDRAVANGPDISLTIKDTLARLDRQLPCRFNPPFVESGAANVMIPLTFGGCRNRVFLLIDAPNRLFQGHDANLPNIAQVADKAAPLDPKAAPPQYVPALSGSGIQLETMPVGKLTVQCSSYGTQAVIPGVSDMLQDDGLFLNDSSGSWSGSAPPGWTWSNLAGSSIVEVLHAAIPWTPEHTNAVQISTTTRWFPSASDYGDYLAYPAILKGGHSYRLTFGAYGIRNRSPLNGGMEGGIMVTTKLDGDASDYLTGYGQPLTASYISTNQNFSCEFTVPAGSDRNLYFIICPSMNGNLANGGGSASLYDVRLELLGQYTELPFSGFPMDNYFTEILVNRAGESSSIFNAAEAAALTTRADGTIIPWGIAFDSPPNIREALKTPLNSFRATMFTDSNGDIRTRKLPDPSDPANASAVICDFDESNIRVGSVSVSPYTASGLTNLVGARHNCSQFGASDFVTDQSIVPQNVKTRFMRISQYERTSGVSPAGEYSSAIGAPIFNTLLDDPDDAQDMIDESVGICAPKVYSDGTFTNGKRSLVEFTAQFDDPAAVGATVTCSLNSIMYGEIVRVTIPNDDGSPRFVNQLAVVKEWEPAPFGQWITLTVLV
jgi:hypothetical protein